MSTRKKIAVVHNLPPGGAHEQFKYNLEFLRKHYSVKVFKEPSPKGNIFSYLFFSLIYLPLIWYPNNISKINHADIIVAYHSWITKSPLFFWIARKPVIYFCHEGMREYYENNDMSLKKMIMILVKFPIMILDQLNVRNAKTVITNSRYSKKIIDKIYKVDSSIIYPGTKITKSNSGILDADTKKESIQISTIGAISSHKRTLFLVELFREISKYKKNIVFNIIYSSYEKDYFTKVKKYVNDNKLNVKFFYNISNAHKNRIIRRTHLSIFSPYKEPYGLSILETLSLGNYVVASNEGGYIEVVSKAISAGIIKTVNSLSIDSWVKVALDFINFPRRRNISNDWIKNYSVDEMNKKLKKIINDYA